jgi:O-Antigen ligase
LSAHAAPVSPPAAARELGAVLREAWRQSWLALSIAAVIAAACFYATGGLDLPSATTTEILVTLGSAGLVLAALSQERAAAAPVWGAAAVAAFFVLALLTALSVSWAIEPSDAWIETGRTFSYAAAFAGAISLTRLAAGCWRSVIAGILLAALVVSAYAVGTKVFPAAGASFARLNAPFDYWNVVGVTAALGVPPALWLGSRRDGHGAQVAIAAAAICLLLYTVMLAYSRGSLLALGLGLAFWFLAVPLRLRGAGVLGLGAAGAALATLWTFSQTALTTDNEPLAVRNPAGHELGWLLVGLMLACAAAALAMRFATLRNPLAAGQRQRMGRALLCGLALVPVVVLVAFAASSRGLFGTISHDWSTLTSTNVSVPNSADRLTALGSQRALYWSAAVKAFDTNPSLGTGADGFQTAFLRYDKVSNTTVGQAHSYVFQTLSDLGIVGLLVSLALAGAWLAAARRASGRWLPARNGAEDGSPERVGLLTLVACVVTYAVHSLIDWTWFVPGVTLIAILCAGWVAGRGPYTAALAPGRARLDVLRRYERAALAGGVAALALLVVWSQWQPLRSQDSADGALAALIHGRQASNAGRAGTARADYLVAARDARGAHAENALDYVPLLYLADAQAGLHELRAGYTTMVRAVELQPSNPYSWYYLAAYDWNQLDEPRAALRALSPSLYLYPQSTSARTLYLRLLPLARKGAPSG